MIASAELGDALERILEMDANESRLKVELARAQAEVNERLSRSEESTVCLRDELDEAQSRIVELSKAIADAELLATDALRAKNALLEDLDSANEKIAATAVDRDLQLHSSRARIYRFWFLFTLKRRVENRKTFCIWQYECSIGIGIG